MVAKYPVCPLLCLLEMLLPLVVTVQGWPPEDSIVCFPGVSLLSLVCKNEEGLLLCPVRGILTGAGKSAYTAQY